jgi:hypothetical protein
VSDAQSIQELLRIDFKASASYLGASGGYSQSSKYDSTFSTQSITVVLRAETDFGEWSIGDAKLTVEANDLLGDPKEFARRFGSRYVHLESRMVGLYVLMTVHGTSWEAKREFESSLTAGAKFGELNANLESKYGRQVTESSKSQRFSLDVAAIGGGGVARLKELVSAAAQNTQDPIPSIMRALGTTLESFTVENAVPYRFWVADMANFGLKDSGVIPWTRERFEKLAYVKDTHESLSFKRDVIKAIREGRHAINRLYVEGDARALTGDPAEVDRTITQLETAHAQLKSQPNVGDVLIPNWLPHAIADHDLRRFLSPAVPNWQGWVYRGGMGSEVANDHLLAIMKTEALQRDDTIRRFYPDAQKFELALMPSGAGISVVELNTRLYSLSSSGTAEVWASNSYTGPWTAISYLPREAHWLQYIQKVRSSSPVRYRLVEQLVIKDKASRAFDYELSRYEFTAHRAISNVAVTHNVRGHYLGTGAR